eukprot:COSAG02_NODE_25015_length_671_cov_0.807692_1_plen_67_part_00
MVGGQAEGASGCDRYLMTVFKNQNAAFRLEDIERVHVHRLKRQNDRGPRRQICTLDVMFVVQYQWL